MSGALRTLGTRIAHRAPHTIALWLILLILAGTGALTLARGATASYTMPSASFEQVRTDLQEAIPGQGISSGSVLLRTENGSFTSAQEEAVAQTLSGIDTLPHALKATNPFEATAAVNDAAAQLETASQEISAAESAIAEGQKALDQARADSTDGLSDQEREAHEAALKEQESQLSQARKTLSTQKDAYALAQRENKANAGFTLVNAEGTSALIPISFDTDLNTLTPDERSRIFTHFDTLEAQGLTVDYSYELNQDISKVMGSSEIIGLVVALIVLFITLGTVIAAGLPLILAAIGVAVALGLVYTSTAFIGMTPTDPALALMIGLGVGIDYALLILHRFRQELTQSRTIPQAIAESTATAGHSVLFAGLTNIIALAALSLTGLPFLAIMGLAGAFSVAIVTASSLTLVPAVLTLLGTKVLTRAQREQAHTNATTPTTASPQNRREAKGELEAARTGWGAFVTRHPFAMIASTLTILALAIIPTTSLRLGLPDGSNQAADSTAYSTYTGISQAYGQGTNGPIIVGVTLSVPGDQNRLRNVALDVADRLKDHRVHRINIAATSEDNSTAILSITPTEGPSTASTQDLVHTMLDKKEATEKATATRIGFTGQTVANIEISDRLTSSIPLYLGVVISLCLLLMAFAFRSVLIPIMATIGFLLSTLASFGAVVAVYQWGWLGTFFGVTEPGPILAFLPILLIGILFGLSVDYQIFIVSGMRDARRAGHTASNSVLLGYKQGGAVVTACGIIMISVFAGFIFSHLTAIRPIGFALALGVAMDAFLIRTTFIPAAMYLLDEAAWWWPGKKKMVEHDKPRHRG